MMDYFDDVFISFLDNGQYTVPPFPMEGQKTKILCSIVLFFGTLSHRILLYSVLLFNVAIYLH